MVTVTSCQIRRHLAKRLFHYYAEGGMKIIPKCTRIKLKKSKSVSSRTKTKTPRKPASLSRQGGGPPAARGLAALKLKTGTEVQAAKQRRAWAWKAPNHPSSIPKTSSVVLRQGKKGKPWHLCGNSNPPRGLPSNHMHKVFKFCALSYT